jgi:chromosome segregation ATPase
MGLLRKGTRLREELNVAQDNVKRLKNELRRAKSELDASRELSRRNAENLEAERDTLRTGLRERDAEIKSQEAEVFKYKVREDWVQEESEYNNTMAKLLRKDEYFSELCRKVGMQEKLWAAALDKLQETDLLQTAQWVATFRDSNESEESYLERRHEFETSFNEYRLRRTEKVLELEDSLRGTKAQELTTRIKEMENENSDVRKLLYYVVFSLEDWSARFDGSLPHERPCSRPVNEGEEDPCDIMHMESLEKACKKASMLVYRTDGELRTKDYEFANMKQAREAAQTEAQGVRDELVVLRREREEAIGKIADLKEQWHISKKVNDERERMLRASIRASEALITESNTRITTLESEIEANTDMIAETRLLLNRSRNETNIERRKASQAAQQIAIKDQKMEFIQQECAKLSTAIGDIEAEREKGREELAAACADYELEMSTQKAAHVEQIEALKKQHSIEMDVNSWKLRTTIERKVKEIKELQFQLAQGPEDSARRIQGIFHGVTREIDHRESRIQLLEDQLNIMTKKLEEAEMRNGSLFQETGSKNACLPWEYQAEADLKEAV